MRIFETLEELAGCVGEVVGTSGWVEVPQSTIDGFAEVTGDRQWIHIDRERAPKGPFGTTIAHGFLTVSLIPQFMAGVFRIEEPTTGVNYGLNKVRFMTPAPSNGRLRAHAKLLEATALGEAAFQFVWQVTVELEGADKPACVAEWVIRRYRAKTS